MTKHTVPVKNNFSIVGGGPPSTHASTPANQVFKQGASRIGQAVGSYITERNTETIKSIGRAVPHPEAHLDPEEIKHFIIEGLKNGKIAGIP